MTTITNPQQPNKRQKRIQRAIYQGLQKWGAAGLHLTNSEKEKSGHEIHQQQEILTSIPRRMISTSPTSEISLPVVQPLRFKTSRLKAVGRLVVWFSMITRFVVGTLWDQVRRRDSEARRAVRLRETFEKVGGTVVKFGQQMAMRIDLLPWAYTVELAKMLDRIPPFKLDRAIEAIERSTGRKWQDIFAVFDPKPIGSASVACVYQARLKNGTKVAVKVRRPGIGELFMADFKAFEWILNLAEFLTIVRPGYTQNIREEFQSTLLDELDFIQEARFQDMFRRNAKKTGKRFFTAPKIFFEYCSQEVVVEEYTSGIWLWEVMAGVEQQNPDALARMRELNIDPKKVAQRLLWVNYWGMQENLIFHADPHPANVIIRRNSRLTFIDFGSCGSFNREQRAGLELTAVASGRNDAEGMARGTMKLFEPLPPLDIKALFQEAEAEYNRVLTIFKSKQEHTEWWERTSVRQWMSFFKFSRENNIPVTIHTLRMIRATLLYDTVAVRICKEVDRFEEYLNFRKFREKQAKKRVSSKINSQLIHGVDDSIFLKLEEVAKTSEKLMYRAQDMLGSPLFNFSSLVGKWVYAVSMGIKLLGRVLLVTLMGMFITAGIQLAEGMPVHFLGIWSSLITNGIFQVIIIVLIIANVRHILFRLRDQEV